MSATALTQPCEFQDGGKPVTFPMCLVDAAGYATSGTTATAVAISANDTTVKQGAGRLCRVIVTTSGTAATLIYDAVNAHTGTIIGAVPASAGVGAFYEFQAPAIIGITVQGNSNNSAITVIWS